MFGIITVKGNASGSRPATRWLVKEAVNASCAWNAIMHASATGSVGCTDINYDVATQKRVVGAVVHRLCNVCGKEAGVYGIGHNSCFYIEQKRKMR
jgi:hypothetical protein